MTSGNHKFDYFSDYQLLAFSASYRAAPKSAGPRPWPCFPMP